MNRKRKPSRFLTLPTNWPSQHYDAVHFDEVDDFLTSAPVTADELRSMAITSGGAQVARLRGIDRK